MFILILLAFCGVVFGGDLEPCGSRPIIAATTLTATSSREQSTVYLISTYGEDVTLFCSAYNAELSIESEGKCLPTTRLNTTTIKLSVAKPCVGQYEYTCKVNNCKDTLIVIVAPAFYVKSQRIHHIITTAGRIRYFVPHGDDYEIFCSGQQLLIREDMKKLETEAVNLTTVKLEVRADQVGIYFYSCTSQGCDGIGKMNELSLIVDFYPEAHNFKCTSYGPHWRKLECSWISSSTENSFKLFLVERNKRQHLLCSFGSGAKTRVCAAENSKGSGSILLQTCNEVFCDNKTYSFEPFSIVKPNAPSELTLLNRTSHGATLKWFTRFAWWENTFKVEYRLLGSAWRQVNTSTVKTLKHSDYCELQLTLPCPDSHYEVRVYVKHNEAEEDRFWSDPSPSFYFFTDPGSMAPECASVLQEPEPITSVETGLNEIGKLIRQTTRERLALKAFVSDMRVKLDRIRALREFIVSSKQK